MEVTEVLGVGQLLTLGSANLIVAALALRNSRRSVKLAEQRVEALRAEQARIVALLREERRLLRRALGEERARHLSLSEARLREERANREPATPPQERERLVEELRRAHEERERERSARLDTEGRIERMEKEILQLRDASQRGSNPLVPAGPPKAAVEARESSSPRPPQPEVRRTSPYETASIPATEVARGNEKPGRAVWHPHPDDQPGARPSPPRAGASVGTPGGARGGARGGAAPVEMFRKHYDKYLENYEGYVELAEGLYRTRRESGEPPHSPFGEREWQDRLRRVKDGIERTTARLDVLEQYNPELATDDRISRRAGIARRHSRLV